MVGRCVAQIASSMGVKTICVVRDNANFDEMVIQMKDYGSYLVVKDSYINTPEFARLTSDLPAPKLALNAVGGPSALAITRALW